MIEELKRNILELEHALSLQSDHNAYLNRSDKEAKLSVEELNSKVLKYESNIRELNKELYATNSENSNLKSDLKNLSDLERTLRQEIHKMIAEREEFENVIHHNKDSMTQAAFELQKSKNENEIMAATIEELRNEVHYFKNLVNQKDKENVYMLRTIDKKEAEISTTKAALERAHLLLDANQSASEYLEVTDKRKINASKTIIPTQYASEYSPYTKRDDFRKVQRRNINPYDSPITTFRSEERPTFRDQNISCFTPKPVSVDLSKYSTPDRKQSRGESEYRVSSHFKSKEIDLDNSVDTNSKDPFVIESRLNSLLAEKK